MKVMEGPVCPNSTKLNKLLPYKTNTQTDTQYDYHTLPSMLHSEGNHISTVLHILLFVAASVLMLLQITKCETTW